METNVREVRKDFCEATADKLCRMAEKAGDRGAESLDWLPAGWER